MAEPNIYDIARTIGVSITTVSHALTGRGRVSPATRERILQAAAEIGYTANPHARSLVSGRSRTIAIQVAGFTSSMSSSSLLPDAAYYMELLNGAAVAAASHDYAIMLATYDFSPRRNQQVGLRRGDHRRPGGGRVTCHRDARAGVAGGDNRPPDPRRHAVSLGGQRPRGDRDPHAPPLHRSAATDVPPSSPPVRPGRTSPTSSTPTAGGATSAAAIPGSSSSRSPPARAPPPGPPESCYKGPIPPTRSSPPMTAWRWAYCSRPGACSETSPVTSGWRARSTATCCGASARRSPGSPTTRG